MFCQKGCHTRQSGSGEGIFNSWNSFVRKHLVPDSVVQVKAEEASLTVWCCFSREQQQSGTGESTFNSRSCFII